MLPSGGKSTFNYHPHETASSALPFPPPAAGTAGDPNPLGNLQQLSLATNEITISSYDLNSIPSSIPSTFFAPQAPVHSPSSHVSSVPPSSNVSSVLTSVSHTKHKSATDSAIGSEGHSCKCSWPTLPLVVAQQESGVAMQEVAAAVRNLSCSMAPPLNNISKAVSLLKEHDELSSFNVLDISDYLANPVNKNQAIAFCSLDSAIRKEWLQWRLREIQAHI